MLRFPTSILQVFLSLALLFTHTPQQAPAAERHPNIVVILIDDMGYADIGPFGQTAYATAQLDRMAADGRVFTDFHAATAVCSASRAALLTGCYPERVGIFGALGPHAKIGLNPAETTLAEICRQRGYATAVFGKWHLGHLPPFLPSQHGFDENYGLPYSNDMWPLHPDLVDLPEDAEERKRRYPPLPMYEGDAVVDDQVDADDQTRLTADYTDRAVDFIRRNRQRPFFLYLPHSMVHVPLFASEEFVGKSGAGLFGDVVMEVDWSVGQVLDALKECGIDQETLVVFTSDNGPWLSYGNHAGSAAPLREGKGTMFEGGYRVPCIMRWPERIPAGTQCDELCTTMDLLPTIANLLEFELPADRAIDGKDIGALLSGGSDVQSPHDALYCYYDGQLRAVRDRRWKLHLPHAYRTLSGREGGRDGRPVAYDQARTGLELYDLKQDVGETINVIDDHLEVVARLLEIAERARNDLGDRLTDRQGKNGRAPGRID